MRATTNFTNLPPEIIQTHILSKLDGSDLGSIACTCSQFSILTNDKNLWRQFCCSRWKSTENPQISQLISTFPSGYRSFVFDSDAAVNTRYSSTYQPFQQPWICPESGTIISAVDIYYDNKPIFSRVTETETNTTKFLCTPFRFGLLEPMETVSTPIRSESDMDVLLGLLKEKLTLSWIVIDPIGKRAANMSSRNPVSIEWPCTAGEVQLCYSTVFLAGDRRPGFKKELVECRVVVTCSGFDEDVVQVDDVSIEIKDTKGRNFDGRESLVILQEALESRRERRKGEEVKKYKELKEKKMEIREGNKMTADGFLLIVCFAVMGFVAFSSSFVLLFVFTVQTRVTKSYRKIKMYMSKLSQLWR